MAFADLIEDPTYATEDEGEDETNPELEAREELGEALGLLDDVSELLLALLDPSIWEGKYISKYLRRETGKLFDEIHQFTDQYGTEGGGVQS